MNTFRYLTVLILLTLLAGPAVGQNDYSLRMRALGVELAGLVTDVHTDAYLNPARLAVFKTTEIYAAKHPGRTLYAYFPILDGFRYYNTIDESRIIESGSNPLVFNVLWPAGRNLVLSFGAQLDISGDDAGNTDSYYEVPDRYDSDVISWGAFSNENTTDEKHLRFDAAAVRAGDRTSLAIRLVAQYDLHNNAYLYGRDNYTMDIATQSELLTDQYHEIRTPGLEVGSLMLSAGLYRPDQLFTDIQLGAGLIRQQITSTSGQLDLLDEDVDGNGWNPWGGDSHYSYELDSYDSNRDYLGYKVFARAHLNPADKLKSTFSAAYEWSAGDGRAVYESIEDQYMNIHEVVQRRISYSYDGSTRQLGLRASIGFSDNIHENIIAAVGLKGVLIWNRFEEDGLGEASFYKKNDGVPDDSLSLSSGYFQRHDLGKTTYHLVVPVACEWNVHKYISLRLGSRFGAEWTDDDREYWRSISDFTIPQSVQNPFKNIDQRIQYKTYAGFSSGMEVNINDRFIVELMQTATYYYAISFTDYSYLSVRYRF